MDQVMLLAVAVDIWWLLLLLGVTGICVFALTRRWTTRRLADAFNRIVEDQRRREAALRSAVDAAESASRQKSELLARLGAEMRAPANGVLDMVDLALARPLPAEQKHYIGAARSNAESLLTVIDEILDYARIEGGRVEPTANPFALRALLSVVLDPLTRRANQKGLELSVAIEPNLPDALVGDADKLQQILANVVGNAMKFTRAGVAVSVHTHARDVDALCLRFCVRDTGIGIPPEQHRSIFHAFTSGDDAHMHHGSAGLGLAVSARFVTALRGHIWVESEPGRGSALYFTTWFRRGSSAAPSPAGPIEPPPLTTEGRHTRVVGAGGASRTGH